MNPIVLRGLGPGGEGQRAEAYDERRREVRPHHSSESDEGRRPSPGEAGKRASTEGQGVAQGGGNTQSPESGGFRRSQGSGPRERWEVHTGAGQPRRRGSTAYAKRHERGRGKVHHPTAPYRRAVAPPSVLLAEAGRCHLGRLRRRPGGALARARKPHLEQAAALQTPKKKHFPQLHQGSFGFGTYQRGNSNRSSADLRAVVRRCGSHVATTRLPARRTSGPTCAWACETLV
jgi:hypothetical protein